MNLPESVKIGHRTYRVTALPAEVGDATKRIGEHSPQQQVIRLDVSLPKSEIAATMLHELFHALWDQACLPKRAREERAVSALAYGMAMMVRDNPEVVKWIQRQLST